MDLSTRAQMIARTLAATFTAIGEHKKARPDEAQMLYELIAATLRATEPMVLNQRPDPLLETGELPR